MKRVLRGVLGAVVALTSLAAATAQTETAPHYAPAHRVSGTIRVWSNRAMQGVVTRWGDGFRRYQPDVRIVVNAAGSDVAVAGLYTERADVALLGREPTASEVQAFEWIYRTKPARVEIMSGSPGSPEHSPALVAFVHRDNPLAQLTLAQLDAIFGFEHLRGHSAIDTWRKLGLGGEWAARPIRLYGPDATSGTGVFFRHVVLRDSRKLNWDRMREFSDVRKPHGGIVAAGRQVVDAVARDRYAIGIAPLGFAGPGVKPLALADDEGGPFVAASATSVASRSYPLARAAYALVRNLPSRPVDPVAIEFLRYVLSDEGQREVSREQSYLPLTAGAARRQLATLEQLIALDP